MHCPLLFESSFSILSTHSICIRENVLEHVCCSAFETSDICLIQPPIVIKWYHGSEKADACPVVPETHDKLCQIQLLNVTKIYLGLHQLHPLPEDSLFKMVCAIGNE